LGDLQNSLFWLRLVQLLIAIPLLALVGQGLVWLLARAFGQPPDQNFFFRLLQTIASPFVRVARWITPRFISDARLPFVALSLLAVGYLWTMLAIASLCGRHGLAIARCLAQS
jgi:hypothetical protein